MKSLFLFGFICSKLVPMGWDGLSTASTAASNCEEGDFLCLASNPQGRQKQSSSGFDACLLMDLYVQNQHFVVEVDTGSSDTVLPYSTLNNYAGSSKISYTFTGSEPLLSGTYGDGSSWSGHKVSLNVSLSTTSISGPAPIILMTSQSTNPVFSTGSTNNGLVGFGYPNIARGGDTIVHYWFQTNVIPKYQIAFQACSPSTISNSWIDVGNETAYSGCGWAPITVYMPLKSYYNVDIMGFAVNGVSTGLPAVFQNSAWSIFDSCTTLLYIPTLAFTSLQTAIINAKSTAFSATLAADANFNSYFAGTGVCIPNSYTSNDIIWGKLPTLSIKIRAAPSSTSYVTLTLGPKQYLMKIPSCGYLFFPADAGSVRMDYAILGFPLFSSYFIVADLTNGLLTFQPGCGCSTATDGYPTIFDSGSNILASAKSTVSSTASTTAVKTSTRLTTTTKTTSTLSRQSSSTYSSVTTSKTQSGQVSSSSTITTTMSGTTNSTSTSRKSSTNTTTSSPVTTSYTISGSSLYASTMTIGSSTSSDELISSSSSYSDPSFSTYTLSDAAEISTASSSSDYMSGTGSSAVSSTETATQTISATQAFANGVTNFQNNGAVIPTSPKVAFFLITSFLLLI